MFSNRRRSSAKHPELNIELVEARNVCGATDGETKNPFVEFSIGEHTSTSTVKEQDQNPKWSEVFKLPVTETFNPSMCIAMWHKTADREDELLGKYRIALSELFLGKQRTVWVNLQYPDPVSGQWVTRKVMLHLKLTPVGFGVLDKSLARASRTLLVRVLEAKNLLPGDGQGLMKPYVELKLGDTNIMRTEVQTKDSASWDEKFAFPVMDTDREVLLLAVKHHGVTAKDRVGKFAHSLQDMKANVKYDMWIDLMYLDHRQGWQVPPKPASLHIMITLKDTAQPGTPAHAPTPVERPDNRESDRILPTPTQLIEMTPKALHIVVLRAVNLPIGKDGSQFSTQVYINVGLTQQFTSVAAPSVCPVWDETLHFPVTDEHQESIAVAVMGVPPARSKKAARALGKYRLFIHKLVQHKPHAIEAELKLQSSETGQWESPRPGCKLHMLVTAIGFGVEPGTTSVTKEITTKPATKEKKDKHNTSSDSPVNVVNVEGEGSDSSSSEDETGPVEMTIEQRHELERELELLQQLQLQRVLMQQERQQMEEQRSHLYKNIRAMEQLQAQEDEARAKREAARESALREAAERYAQRMEQQKMALQHHARVNMNGMGSGDIMGAPSHQLSPTHTNYPPAETSPRHSEGDHSPTTIPGRFPDNTSSVSSSVYKPIALESNDPIMLQNTASNITATETTALSDDTLHASHVEADTEHWASASSLQVPTNGTTPGNNDDEHKSSIASFMQAPSASDTRTDSQDMHKSAHEISQGSTQQEPSLLNTTNAALPGSQGESEKESEDGSITTATVEEPQQATSSSAPAVEPSQPTASVEVVEWSTIQSPRRSSATAISHSTATVSATFADGAPVEQQAQQSNILPPELDSPPAVDVTEEPANDMETEQPKSFTVELPPLHNVSEVAGSRPETAGTRSSAGTQTELGATHPDAPPPIAAHKRDTTTVLSDNDDVDSLLGDMDHPMHHKGQTISQLEQAELVIQYDALRQKQLELTKRLHYAEQMLQQHLAKNHLALLETESHEYERSEWERQEHEETKLLDSVIDGYIKDGFESLKTDRETLTQLHKPLTETDLRMLKFELLRGMDYEQNTLEVYMPPAPLYFTENKPKSPPSKIQLTDINVTITDKPSTANRSKPSKTNQTPTPVSSSTTQYHNSTYKYTAPPPPPSEEVVATPPLPQHSDELNAQPPPSGGQEYDEQTAEDLLLNDDCPPLGVIGSRKYHILKDWKTKKPTSMDVDREVSIRMQQSNAIAHSPILDVEAYNAVKKKHSTVVPVAMGAELPNLLAEQRRLLAEVDEKYEKYKHRHDTASN